jgi:hypothetical protein
MAISFKRDWRIFFRIAVVIRSYSTSMAAFFVALGYQFWIDIRTVGDLMERCFSEFAGVPYQGPLSRQQWEDLLEPKAEP